MKPTEERTTRQRILDAVRRYPGIHLRELARELGMSIALVEYHVPFLQRNDLLITESDGSYTRLYATGENAVPADRRPWLAVLRQEHPLRIVLALLGEDGPVRHGALHTTTGLGKSKLSFHLRKLESAGIVEKTPDGFALVDRETTKRLLLRHRPTSDLRDRFAAFWAGFYDR